MKALRKSTVLLIGFIFAIMVIACRKDREEPKPLPRNSAQVTMQGKPWNYTLPNGIPILTQTSCITCWAERLDTLYKNFFFLTFYHYYEEKGTGVFDRNSFEDLTFGAVPYRIGKFELLGKITACRPDTIPAARFYTNDYDVGKDMYEVLKSEKHYIELTKIDKATGYVEGEFMMTFIRTRKGNGSDYPDTLRFQPSRFSAFIGANE